MKRLLILGTTLAVLGGGSALSQQSGAVSPEQMVAIRKAMMDLQQGVAGAMKAAVEAKADVKPLVPGAKGLVSSGKVIVSMFPPGTEKVGDTKAKPAVWSDEADFAKDADALVAAAEKLVAAADANDKAEFATQFAAVGRTCGACHRQYKEQQ